MIGIIISENVDNYGWPLNPYVIFLYSPGGINIVEKHVSPANNMATTQHTRRPEGNTEIMTYNIQPNQKL